MAENVTKTTVSDDEKALWDQVRMAILGRIQGAVATATPAELRELLSLYHDFYRDSRAH